MSRELVTLNTSKLLGKTTPPTVFSLFTLKLEALQRSLGTRPQFAPASIDYHCQLLPLHSCSREISNSAQDLLSGWLIACRIMPCSDFLGCVELRRLRQVLYQIQAGEVEKSVI
jgi:hypothetical protein